MLSSPIHRFEVYIYLFLQLLKSLIMTFLKCIKVADADDLWFSFTNPELQCVPQQLMSLILHWLQLLDIFLYLLFPKKVFLIYFLDKLDVMVETIYLSFQWLVVVRTV